MPPASVAGLLDHASFGLRARTFRRRTPSRRVSPWSANLAPRLRLGQLSLRPRRASDSLARRQPSQAEDHRVSGVQRPRFGVSRHGLCRVICHWQTTRSVTCPYPPCINDVQRPDPRLGTINSFESGSSSVYNGMTSAAEAADRQGFSSASATPLPKPSTTARMRWWWDVPAMCRTPMPRNWSADSASPISAIASWLPPSCEPRSFHFEQPLLNALCQPLEGLHRFHRRFGTAYQCNHGGRRQSRRQYLQRPAAGRSDETPLSVPTTSPPTFASRASYQVSERVQRDSCSPNRSTSPIAPTARVIISDDGFYNSAGQFVAYSTKVAGTLYPGEFQNNSKFLMPTNAYAPRQVQFSLRLSF